MSGSGWEGSRGILRMAAITDRLHPGRVALAFRIERHRDHDGISALQIRRLRPSAATDGDETRRLFVEELDDERGTPAHEEPDDELGRRGVLTRKEREDGDRRPGRAGFGIVVGIVERVRGRGRGGGRGRPARARRERENADAEKETHHVCRKMSWCTRQFARCTDAASSLPPKASARTKQKHSSSP